MGTKTISKTGMSFFILAALMLCLFTGLAYAQENWIYTYSPGTDYYSDYANDIVVSPYDGNVYVAGYTREGGTYGNFTAASLDPITGSQNWIYRYHGAGASKNEAYSICVGIDKYIYVAGYTYGTSTTRAEFTVVKLDTLGNLKWMRKYNGNNYQYDYAYDIVYGADNHIYVAGYLYYSNKAFVVMKLDTLGTREWIYTWNGAGHDIAQTIVYGADNHIYAAGQCQNVWNVVKLDTLKNQKWFKWYGSSSYAKSIDFGADNNIYVAGYSTGSNGKDFVVIQLDTLGNLGWDYVYDGPGHGEDIANSVVHAGGSAVYAAGYSTDTTGGGGKDYTVICLSGWVPSWIYRYNGPGNGDDRAMEIDISSSGFAYAVGYAEGDGTNEDLIVTKHDDFHEDPWWVYTYNGNDGDDGAKAIDISSGDLYVAGYLRPSGTLYDFAAMSLPENFPPTIPTLISPADSSFLNDTTSITLIWHASEDYETSVAGYFVSRSMNPAFTICDTVFRTDTSYTDTYLDTIWYWRVKAFDSEGSFCDWSDAWSFSFDLTAPDIPVLISPIADEFVLDTSVTFDWGEVTFMGGPLAPVRYVLQIDTNDAFPSSIVEDTFDITNANLNLAGDDRYYWRVKAYDLAQNESNYATAESFRLDISPPLIESTTVWNDTIFAGPYPVYSMATDLFGVDSVILYFKRMEDPVWFPVKMIQGSGDIYFEEIPPVGMANDTVKYYIYAKDNAGRTSFDPAGAPADYYWFIGGYDPGVMEFGDTPTVFSFGLQSNPTKGRALFNLALPEAANVTLRIYDVTGRLIDKVISGRKSAGYYEIPWTKDVSSGIFFYHLDSPWQQKIGKLVLLK